VTWEVLGWSKDRKGKRKETKGKGLKDTHLSNRAFACARNNPMRKVKTDFSTIPWMLRFDCL
jgi:hypothetical protein